MIALLCADYRFETLPWPRLLAIFAATFALILTRRWYMFWILAFYAVYVLAMLVGAVRRKTLGSTLKHMLLFGVPSAVIIVGALLLIGLTYYRIDWARHPEKYQDLVEQAEKDEQEAAQRRAMSKLSKKKRK